MSIHEIDDVDRLKRINAALMNRVESAMDQHGNAFSLFQTAINLEGQVKRRTDELTIALRGLEKTNLELAVAKEASEKANLSKTRFLAAASHDVLQPLNAALLSISVLADLQQTDAGKSLARQIERSLDTMHELLKTLLNISKLDAGVVEPNHEDVRLAVIFDDLRSDFEPIATEKDISLRFRDNSISVKTDSTMLRRVLQNLISNGLRYTKSGGVLIGARNRTDEVWIDVIDTGCGIAPEHHEQIFEEFHRGAMPSGHEREANSGLGLGLSIVSRMVSALEHKLELRSVVDRGSVFRVKLPRAQKNIRGGQSPRFQSSPARANLEGANILLIENDPAGVRAASLLFESWGCEVAVAMTSEEALRSVGDTDWIPDVVVADLHLDNGDLGTLAVERVRTYLGRTVPALIVTADPTKTLNREIRKLKMELMQKPLKPARLRALMSHMLS